jgi:hypothetical protein
MRRLLPLLLLLPACVSVRVGPDDEFFRVRGLAHAHASVNGLDDYDGSLLDIGILTNTRGRGELVSVEVGPLAGVGVGLFGARARVLPLELGAGVGFYDPRPRQTTVSYYEKSDQKTESEKEQDDHGQPPAPAEPKADQTGSGDQATTSSRPAK